MKISRIYRWSLIYPSLVLLTLVTVVSIIINADYKSEWITPGAAIEMDIAAALTYCALVCVLALTIFLNEYERVASNPILSALCWFLLPGGFICWFFAKAVLAFIVHGITSSIEYLVVMNLPFAAGLVWGFWRFRKTRLHLSNTSTK